MSPTLVNTDFLHYQSQSLQLQTTLTMENNAWNVETHALLPNNQELNRADPAGSQIRHRWLIQLWIKRLTSRQNSDPLVIHAIVSTLKVSIMYKEKHYTNLQT